MGQNVSYYTNYFIYEHTFIGHNSVNFYGNSRDYCLSIGYKEFWFWALIAIFDFLGHKKGAAPQIPIFVWNLKSEIQPKSWPTWWTFWGHLLSRNCVSNFCDLGPFANFTGKKLSWNGFLSYKLAIIISTLRTSEREVGKNWDRKEKICEIPSLIVLIW